MSAHAQSHHDGPIRSISQRSAASSGPPSATATPAPFRRSRKKPRSVWRLKPCFSSMRKVE